MTLMVTKFIPESNIKKKMREKNFTLIRLTINNPHFVARVVAQWCIPVCGYSLRETTIPEHDFPSKLPDDLLI